MATFRAGTVNATTYTGGTSHSATRDIVAGDLVVFPITWEDSQTLSSVTDSAGGTWGIAIQLDYGSGAPQPIGAIAYCLNHPGGTGVVVTGNFSGSAAPILEADILCFQPAGGNTFVLDGTASGTGTNSTFVTSANITTTGAGVVVEFASGFQLTTGVTAGGSPAFTRDTATENNGVGRSFAQYLLSGSAQTVTPGASWGAAGAKWVFLAAAFKEVAASGGPTIDTNPTNQTCYVGQTATFNVSATTSGGTLHYQWKDDGVNVDTDSNSYTTAAATLGDNGAQITCVVSDDNGNATSAAATWTVLPAASLGWIKA